MANSYRPSRDNFVDAQTRKRHRREDPNPRKRLRSQSPSSSQDNRGSNNPDTRQSQSYRPTRNYHDRPRYDSWRPTEPSHNDFSPTQEPPIKNDASNSGHGNNEKRNRKSKRDRKENPSSRIHSLRKLIQRGTLPPPIQAEKERELSTLLFEREKRNLKTASKRNLERYHFVRFMERQKAQRTLKSLRKLDESGQVKDQHGRNLKERLEEAEIDLNYTLYAPLGEKYISIFAEQRKGEQVSKAEKYKGNWKMFTPEERKFLDQKQLDQLQEESMEAANVLEIFGNVPDGGASRNHEENAKPPVWYEVKAAMEQGDGKLEALRERVRGTGKETGLVLGLKAENKQKPGWLEDDGMIDPADLDSESDETMQLDSRSDNWRGRKELAGDDDDDDEAMSDGDGGFFEKR